jgi:uncharacterized membrane protein YeaQ/YmgE (transglycosylase-associated protein family)
MFVIVLGLLAGFIASSMRKSSSGLKIMLLGINLTLFGGIIAVDAESNLGGIEYLIALLGLIISAIGLGKEE